MNKRERSNVMSKKDLEAVGLIDMDDEDFDDDDESDDEDDDDGEDWDDDDGEVDSQVYKHGPFTDEGRAERKAKAAEEAEKERQELLAKILPGGDRPNYRLRHASAWDCGNGCIDMVDKRHKTQAKAFACMCRSANGKPVARLPREVPDLVVHEFWDCGNPACAVGHTSEVYAAKCMALSSKRRAARLTPKQKDRMRNIRSIQILYYVLNGYTYAQAAEPFQVTPGLCRWIMQRAIRLCRLRSSAFQVEWPEGADYDTKSMREHKCFWLKHLEIVVEKLDLLHLTVEDQLNLHYYIATKADR